MNKLLTFFATIILALAVSAHVNGDTRRQNITDILSGDSEGAFARAIEAMKFVFPKDHGPHPDYKIEWWYYTGNLKSDGGREFGYQLTIFRRALAADMPVRKSRLATNQIYMAHFALTDVRARTHTSFERYSRGAGGLAGARGEPTYEVWLEDWSVSQDSGSIFRLRAVDDQIDPRFAIDLNLRETRLPLLHGEQGLSQKGPERGNANHYYSLVGLDTKGTITSGGEEYHVSGKSWMDHEFGTSALSKGVVGWDWFGLQLDDGTALMFGRLRVGEGGDLGIFEGTISYADGRQIPIQPGDFTVTATGSWNSPETGITYPSGWQVHFPSLDIELHIEPLVPNQELFSGFTYWEGAVSVEGKIGGQTSKGRGYVELTGYER
ncbi:MAG: carotenoid 1,2-hydratase [Candidatus Poribacteria bacterium]|nr:carotenoid 1,2-hydratase [Candidatus Poribacteria bacterium]MDE0505177.1 carotenoid 1,2-hydratase [Candidatus Poribacteria bacterium]